MNEVSDAMVTGKIGEMIVQLRLFEYGVEAAPPLTDTGNDLIAVRGSRFRALQVKTSKDLPRIQRDRLPEQYHLLGLVELAGEDRHLHLDECTVYMLPRSVIEEGDFDLDDFILSPVLVEELFGPMESAS